MTQIVDSIRDTARTRTRYINDNLCERQIVVYSNDITNSEIYPVSDEIKRFPQFFHEPLNYSNKTE